MDEKLWYLKQANLFEQLSAEEIARVESRSRMQVFPRKGIVYLPNDPGHSVFLLTSGRIRLYHVTSEGKESVLAFIEPGEIFGELSLFGQAQREEFAEAMEKSTIVRIPGDEMQQLMTDRPEIVLQVTRLMGLRRQRIERRLKALLFRSNRDRLVYLLLNSRSPQVTPIQRCYEICPNLRMPPPQHEAALNRPFVVPGQTVRRHPRHSARVPLRRLPLKSQRSQ